MCKRVNFLVKAFIMLLSALTHILLSTFYIPKNFKLSSKMNTSMPSRSLGSMETINSRWLFGLLAMLASYCQGNSTNSEGRSWKIDIKKEYISDYKCKWHQLSAC